MTAKVRLGALDLDVATDSNGSPRITRTSRPSQPADAGEPKYADWRVDGHDLNSFEVIPAGGQAGYLGRDYGEGTDGRWWGLDCLGPKVNTLDLSTYDTDSDIVRDANCSAVAYAVWATAYQYVGRGTRPAKIDLSDMSLKDGGKSLPREVSDLIVTVAEANGDSLAVEATSRPSSSLVPNAVVSIDGNYAYIPDLANFLIFDISDPSSISEVGSVALANSTSIALSADGATAYVTSSFGDSLSVVDVSDPTSPSVTGSVQDETNLDAANGVAVSIDGDYVYVSCFNADRLTVVDVSTPATPSVAGSVTDTDLDGAIDVVAAAAGTYAYVVASSADRLVVVDVSTPATPSVTGSVQDGTNLNRPMSVVESADGDYVYVAAEQGDKFTVVDVQTPATPTVVGNATVSDALKLALSPGGTTAYVYSSGGTISSVDVTTPASPTVEDTITSLAAFGGLSGDLAVIPQTGGIIVVTIADGDLDTIAILATSNLEVSAGQGDVAPYYVLPVADIADPADTGVDDGWVENDDSEAAKVFGLAPDRVVGMAKNVIKSNILTGSTTMKNPNWLTTATITGQKNNLTSTGFAMDGNLWVIGTTDGPYMLDSQTREFWPILPELDLSDENCRNLANWFPLGVVMPLQYSLRWQKAGSGESFGEEEFKQNTSPVQGTPTAWTASAREGFEIRYNEEEGDAYLVVWRPREAGDQHGEIMSPYVIAKFADKKSRVLEWVGTADGLRTNPTLTGGYGSDMFWLTAGRTARWIDDANYEYTASGTTYLTEMRRLRNVLADVEYVELEVRRSDGGALDANKTVTVQMAFDEDIESGTYTTVGSAISSAGFHRLVASSSGVPVAGFQGVRRMKMRWTLTTDDDSVSPQVIGIARVYYRTRPTTIEQQTYTFELNDNYGRTPKEKEDTLRTYLSSAAQKFEDAYNNTYYVRVVNVGEVKIESVGQGRDSDRGTRSIVSVQLETWTTS